MSANQGYTEATVFSDNDSLAGLVAKEVQAELLVLLTDVGGVYDKPPSQVRDEGLGSLDGRGCVRSRALRLTNTPSPPDTTRQPDAKQVSIYRREYCPAIGDKSAQGRGGMQAKIDAAMSAVKGGVPSVVIASGHEPGVIGKVAGGAAKGTLFSRAVLFPEGE